MTVPLPYYEYRRSRIHERLNELTSLSAPFGLTVRYAVKANPHPEIVRMVHEAGLHFDASSAEEARHLLALGVPGSHISLSSQQSSSDLAELVRQGILYTATSVHQLDQAIALNPATVGVRINPDVGYGHNKRTSTGGKNASFGIWHEYLPEVRERVAQTAIKISRLHVHIGSGADPSVWGSVMDRALAIAEHLPEVTTLNIGGGFKVSRYPGEEEADLSLIMSEFTKRLTHFFDKTGRKLHLEIEPGTYVVAHAGTLCAQVDDIVDTGADGYTFLRLTTGMNDFLRSALYGAQHRIEVITTDTDYCDYVVVGHGCESGDILTPAQGNPEEIETRTLRRAKIGDEVRIYDTGAYGASLRAKGYNGFPDAPEVFVD